MDLGALGLTLRLAGLTTLCLLVAALPLAMWLASVPGSAGGRWARWVVQAAVALPLVLPPTVLGFYLLMGFGPMTAVGRALTALLGPLAFSFRGLLAGSVVYSLPFAVQPLVAGFSGVDRGLVETARVLGASRWRVFRQVLLPLAKGSVLLAAVLTFAHTVGEFGVVLMVGGDVPGVTRTLSIAIFDKVQELDYAGANRMALWLVAGSFVALLAVVKMQGSGVKGPRAKGQGLEGMEDR